MTKLQLEKLKTHGAKRSPKWPKARAAHLKKFPVCAACGGKKNLNVHHVAPFHLHPDKELDPKNLITLCENPKSELHCHIIWGHLLNWSSFNITVRTDAAVYGKKVKGRP